MVFQRNYFTESQNTMVWNFHKITGIHFKFCMTERNNWQQTPYFHLDVYILLNHISMFSDTGLMYESVHGGTEILTVRWRWVSTKQRPRLSRSIGLVPVGALFLLPTKQIQIYLVGLKPISNTLNFLQASNITKYLQAF